MLITFDPKKRQKTIDERQLDFIDAPEVFSGRTYDWEDERYDYGEVRIITVGWLHGRMVVLVWTQRGDARHIISLRKANGREQDYYRELLG